MLLKVFAADCSVSLFPAKFDGNPYNWDCLRSCDHSSYSSGVGGIATSDTADDITVIPSEIEASSENPVRPVWGASVH